MELTKNAIYSNVPSPKEVSLSQQLLILKTEKDEMEESLKKKIHQLEEKLHISQNEINDLAARLQSTRREHTKLQHDAVLAERRIWETRLESVVNELEVERKEKFAQEQWQKRYEDGSMSNINTADIAFCHFGQSLAMLKSCYAPYLVPTGVISFLIQLLRESKREVVLGPVLLTLTHFSLYKGPNSAINISEILTKSGVVPSLVCICQDIKHDQVLLEVGKLFASLAMNPASKILISAKHGVKSLIFLTNDIPESSTFTLSSILSALVNLSHDSDVIRSQIVNCGAIPRIVYLLDHVADEKVKTECAKLIGNVANGNLFNQEAIIMSNGDTILMKFLDAQNYPSPLIAASAIGLLNLCCTEANQASIGYSETMPRLVQLLVDSKDADVLQGAACAIGNLSFQNILNKTRIASLNGVQALLYVLSWNTNAAVLIATCNAIASLVLFDGNRRIVEEVDGCLPILELCSTSTDEGVMVASATAIAALIPDSDVLLSILSEGKQFIILDNNGQKALERVKFSAYKKNKKLTPKWLDNAIHTLKEFKDKKIPRFEDSIEMFGVKEELSRPELFERRVLFLQSTTQVLPDELCTTFYEDEEVC